MTMQAFLTYLLMANVLLLFQALYYRLFLARQRRFQLNRLFLLGGMAATLLLPLIRWNVVETVLPQAQAIAVLPEIQIGAAQPVPISAGLTAWEMVLGIYLLGMGVSLAALLLRNLRIILLIRKGTQSRHQGYTLVNTSADMGPASYFRFIFWNEAWGLDPQSRQVALAHERCHSRQWHTLDLLGVELLKAFCWMNPAVYLLRRDLRNTHEYIADQAALKVAGADGIRQLLLVRQLGAHSLPLANHFHSPVKSRLMILSQHPRSRSILRYLLALPLAGLLAACTSLGHPADSRQAAETAASPSRSAQGEPVTKVTYAPVYDIENAFYRAQMPAAGNGDKEKALVCLGPQPEVLNLDTVLEAKTTAPDEVQPELLNLRKIAALMGYPKEAEEQKITGKVVVKLLVDERGLVVRHQYLHESHSLLRDAVEAHVNELLFKPGTKNGKPAEWWVIVPFNFGMGGC